MDCSHVHGRRHRTIRWCQDNAKALCTTCHRWWHENPTESGKWYEALVGEGHMALLREKRDSMMKVSKGDEKEIAKHYRMELAKIELKRGHGVQGYIEFVSYQ